MLLKEPVLRQFGTRLRKARTDKGLSQENLALSVGFDRTYVSLLERGKRNPSLFVIYQLATFLRIDITELFSDEG